MFSHLGLTEGPREDRQGREEGLGGGVGRRVVGAEALPPAPV